MSTNPGESASADRLLEAFALLNVLGLVGLALTALIGFEEANGTLLAVFSACVFAAPVAILVHLGRTKQLTGHEKYLWLREFTGPRMPWAVGDYVTSDDRRATIQRRLAESRRRPDGPGSS